MNILRKKSQQAKGRVRYKKNKRSNIKFNGSWRREQNGREAIFEDKMAENFPDFRKGKKPQIQEAKRVPNRINKLNL